MLDNLPICAVMTIMINLSPSLSVTELSGPTRWLFKLKMSGDIFFTFISSEGKTWEEAIEQLHQTITIIFEQGRAEMNKHPSTYRRWRKENKEPVLDKELLLQLIKDL